MANRWLSAITSALTPPSKARCCGDRQTRCCPLQFRKRRGDIGKGSFLFQQHHRINRHKAVGVFSIVRIIPPQSRLGFACQSAGRLDAHILDQRFGVLFQIAANTCHTSPLGSHKVSTRVRWESFQSFPIKSTAWKCHGFIVPRVSGFFRVSRPPSDRNVSGSLCFRRMGMAGRRVRQSA